MKDFLFVYRTNYDTMPESSPEDMQAVTKKWMDWLAGIASQNKLVDQGKRLEQSGKVVKGAGVVINGPYSEIKESIGGYSMVKSESYDSAVELAKECPILAVGGNVEVREISIM